ncbi:hypothetical protein AB6A40_005732 [Gnathostoma spinigerum]|uniref:Apolipoprotein L3 n=1 Tax=Gnathostoma spinigerum TaxID=75299 RepID=A0ABD6EGG0_9BILA
MNDSSVDCDSNRKTNDEFASPYNDIVKDSREQRNFLIKSFANIYKSFKANRENLLTELKNIADECNRVKKNCAISKVATSSIGIVGGTAAIVGTVSFPPLFIGGLMIAGLSSISSIGTSAFEYVIFHKSLRKVRYLLNDDRELAEKLEAVFEAILFSDLFDIQSRKERYEDVDDTENKGAPENRLHLTMNLGSGVLKGAASIGARSIGTGVVETSAVVFRGIARTAIGIGILIDSYEAVMSSKHLATRAESEIAAKIAIYLEKLQKELDMVVETVKITGLLDYAFE